jgi:hypothetical protein
MESLRHFFILKKEGAVGRGGETQYYNYLGSIKKMRRRIPQIHFQGMVPIMTHNIL